MTGLDPWANLSPAERLIGVSAIDEARLRDAVRACIVAEADSPSAYAREIGVVDEQLLSVLRGVRPAEPKLLEALGYRRITTYAGALASSAH